MVDFIKMRSEARKELQNLVQERTALDRKIIGLEQTIRGLDAVCGPDAEPATQRQKLDPVPLPPGLEDLLTLGLTDAVRKLFENSGVLLLTPVSVRDQLLMYGYSLPMDNPVAAIHAVFRRLEDNLEIMDTLTEDRKQGYRWQNPIERAITREQNRAIAAWHASDMAAEAAERIAAEQMPKYGQPDPLNKRRKRS